MSVVRISRRATCALVLVLAATVSIFVGSAQPARAATVEEVFGFGSNPGNLRMVRYVPNDLPAGRPLVVALHGCDAYGPTPALDYARHSGWTELADRWNFTLLLPRQQAVNNGSRCFNWFNSYDTARGRGEAASINQMVRQTVADYGADPNRIYVTGLSAGGAMTAVMLATYPDVFAGGGIVAGIPYRCATNAWEAFGCMNPGVDLSAQRWGDRVRAATSYTGPWPTVSIWHGSEDYTVRPMNLRELAQQWTNVHRAGQSPDSTGTIAGYPHAVYENAAGKPVVETTTVTGMGHGQAVDPGSRADQCGSTGSFYPDFDVCTAYHLGKSWQLAK